MSASVSVNRLRGGGGRAQNLAASSSEIDRVQDVAREKKRRSGKGSTTLLHHIDASLLRQAYFG
jgi:hypothetical protein